MRVIWAAIILTLSLSAGTVGAAATPDRCVAQEKALRTEAVEACNGLSYLFNPSGCFTAQKALKAFDGDKCRATVASEQTEPAPPQAVSVAVPPPRRDLQEKAPHEAAGTGPDVAQLKAENARLKAEIGRLRAEMEQLRGK